MENANKHNFIRAVKFIYQNIDIPMNLEQIAKNLGMSVSTLKRLFIATTDSSVGCFIRRLKMERAFRSLKNKEDSVLEIALSCGFEDHSAFTRSFKENFGYSPTYARSKINIVGELECISLEDPEIVEIEAFKIQAITTQGLYFEAAPRAWESLKKQLNDSSLNDDFTEIFVAIGHDNPHDGEIEEDKVRFSAGVAHLDHSLGYDEIIVTKGTYAKFNFTGKLNNMGLAYHYIYGAWLNKSIVKIDNEKPAFMIMDTFPEDFHEHKVSIYVPLAV